MFETCICVGIEVRHTKDYTTKAPKDVYYFHGKIVGKDALDGYLTFSAKIPDHLCSQISVGSTYLLAYTSYNGYRTIAEVFVK